MHLTVFGGSNKLSEILRKKECSLLSAYFSWIIAMFYMNHLFVLVGCQLEGSILTI